MAEHNPVLCIVCKSPSAFFMATEDGKGFHWLTKTMRRVTGKAAPEKLYVHESPCLDTLVKNWAQYIVDERGLKALGKKND
jgi:hypothetical protein